MKEVTAYIKNRKFLLLQIANILAAAVSNAGKLIVPIFLGYLIDSYEQGLGVNLKPILPLVVATTIIVTISDFFNDFLNNYISQYLGWSIKKDLMKKILSNEWSFVMKFKRENLFNILDNDVNVIKNFLSTGFVAMINGILLLLGSAFLMFRINTRLALSVMLVVPVLWAFFSFFFMKSRKYFSTFRKIIDKLSKRMQENITVNMLIRVFSTQKYEQKKFEIINKKLYINGRSIVNVFSIIIPFISFVTTGVYLLVLWLGGKQAISGELTVGEMTQFVYYTTSFTAPLILVGFLSTSIANSIESSKRISSVINHQNDFEDGNQTVSLFENMEFKNVYYDGIIQDVSFKINRGEKIGILGATGSGKSTVLGLITRLYDPSDGEIFVNSKDLKSLKIVDYRSLIGYVPQESYLFTASVRDNICFGAKYNKELFNKVVRVSMVDEFVPFMDGKYDAMIGERGANLSGGQKQRISLARALYSGKDILIMDDSTSKLDINTERKVMKRIKKEFSHLTIIIVAQKIITVQDCNYVLLLDHGKSIGFDTPTNLSIKNDLYKQIMESQQ